MIKTQNLERYYPLAGGRYYVLRRINLDIPEGEFVTIMGPSGAGKSTLLSIIGMLVGAWTGEYFFGEQPVHKLSVKQLVALLHAEFVNGLLAEEVFAGPSAVEHADDAEQSRLPCPGRSHDGDEFPGLDVEIDTPQDEEFLPPSFEGFLQIFQLNERLHVCSFLFITTGDHRVDTGGTPG